METIKNNTEEYLKFKQTLFVSANNNDLVSAKKAYLGMVDVLSKLSAPLRIVSANSVYKIIAQYSNDMNQIAALYKELVALSFQKFPDDMIKVIEKSVDEIVNSLCKDSAEKEKLRDELLKNIKPKNLETYIIPEYFEKNKRDVLIATLYEWDIFIHSSGLSDIKKKIITFPEQNNLLEFKSTLIHEMIHYLGDKGLLKTNKDWEFLTFGGEASHNVVNFLKNGLSIEKAKDIIMPILSTYVNTPNLARGLFEKGMELSKENKNIFQIKLGVSGENAEYFSVKNIAEEVISVYEKNGINSDELKLYLTYLARPPQNNTERAQYMQVTYGAERPIGILLAGFIPGGWQKTKVEPLVWMKKYFDELYKFFGSRDKEDEDWINKELIPLLREYIKFKFGSDVDFKVSEKADEMGLWKYVPADKKNPFAKSSVEYWRTSLLPARVEREEDKLEAREEVKKKAFGHIELAQVRALYGASPSFNEQYKDDLADPVFKGLWDFMTIPKSIAEGEKGFTGMGKGKYAGIPLHIKDLFNSLFNMGNEKIEKDIFNSYPLHLQYINAILKIWSSYEGKENERYEDKWVEVGSLVEQVIVATHEKGWKPIFFYPADFNYEEIFEIVKNEIYPEYKKLFEEEQKREIERKKKEGERTLQSLPQFPPMPSQQPQPGQQPGQQPPQPPQSGQQGQQGQQGQPSAISDLTPPGIDADTLDKTLKGQSGGRKEKFKRTVNKKVDPLDINALSGFDAMIKMMSTGLTEEELKVYEYWKNLIPYKTVKDVKEAFKAFLVKLLGRKFKSSDDLSHEWVDIVDISMSQGGTAKTVKKRPFPVKFTFLLDRSGSMSETVFNGYPRSLFSRLMMMLFLDVMIEINSEYEGLFEWETIIFERRIEKITNFKESKNIKKGRKARVIYDTLTSMEPSGGTNDIRAFATSLKSALDAKLKQEGQGINIVLSIGDGNMGTNIEIKNMLDTAEKKGVYTRVVSVGDNEANQSVVNTCGEKRAIIPPAGDFNKLPKICWEAFIDILEEVTGYKVRQMSSYLGEKGNAEINPAIRRVFSDLSEKSYEFVEGLGTKGRSDENKTGRLFESITWIDENKIDMIFSSVGSGDIAGLKTKTGKTIFKEVENENRFIFNSALTVTDFSGDEYEKEVKELFARFNANKAKKEKYTFAVKEAVGSIKESAPEITTYDIVFINADFSGYCRYKRGGRIYIPLDFMDTLNEKAGKAKEGLKDFILHEYLECLLARYEKLDTEEAAINSRENEIIEDMWQLAQNASSARLTNHELVLAYLKQNDAREGRLNAEGKSIHEQIKEVYEKHRRYTGYRNFFYERENGVDYLVYDNGASPVQKWTRGTGKINVPEKITIDDDDNESIILEDIIQKLYSQEVKHRSYTIDGNVYIRGRPDGSTELNVRGIDGIWPSEPFRVYKKSVEYKKEYIKELGGTIYFDNKTGEVRLVKIEDGIEKEKWNLKFEQEEDIKQNRVLVLKGEPGLGKDELLHAMSHLMGEELWYLVGHEDATESDIVAKRVLTEEGSKYVYSSLNYVQHNGGIVVISEGQYIDEEAFGALKEAIASGQHERIIKERYERFIEKSEGKLERIVRKTVTNHPRSRIVLTTNIKRRGIKIEGFNDQAILERFITSHFVWKRPPEEIELEYRLVMEKLGRVRPELKGEELEKTKKKLWNIAKGLVDVVSLLRLGFMDYNAEAIQVLRADNFLRWKELLRDNTFQVGRVDSQGKMINPRVVGDKVRRAPSPRVAGKVLEFASMFPKTWENEPWKVIRMFFNFDANNMDEVEKEKQMAIIKQMFNKGYYEDENNIKINFKDKGGVEPIHLTEKSFRWEGEYLIVEPEKIDKGNGGKEQVWDKLKIWCPEPARGQKLPKEIKKWLSTGNGRNQGLLYQMLQLRELGINIMLIGDAGTGKSYLSRGVCKLLSGPDIESYNLSQATRLNKLLEMPELDKDGKVYNQYGPVLRAAIKGKIVFIDELTQGRPGVQAGLNEALQRNLIVVTEEMLSAERGFGFIFAANTPGGPFKVEAPSDEFIERCAVLKVDPLPTEELHSFLEILAEGKGKVVNPRVIGEKKIKNSATGETEKIQVGDKREDRYMGLAGVYQYLRKKIYDNPEERLLRRVPGFRLFEVLIPHIRDYWKEPHYKWERNEKQFYQKQLWKYFKDFFEQAAKDNESLYEIEILIKEAFEASGLWSNDVEKDGVLEYLNGEDMVLRKVIRNAKTGDKEIDKKLNYIQTQNSGSSVKKRLEEIRKEVEKLVVTEEEWGKFKRDEKLERLYKAREIWQILYLITSKRGEGTGLNEYPTEIFRQMKSIMEKIQSRIHIEENRRAKKE
ncbi:ATPase, AAA+ type, core domain protein [Candidatus Omnitrophus magneticus]|uniref:ATPase, AAA+ type, core domain protein n=1 Tax=Candidatus Omnitrophus magneticus TaxID=1609969 RepID=A0A0F0CJN1_9BACT|nr:ATPase, AAA+ type, core domain protein [Candidatus Omnitrophus magneticus]